jgi:hypothetical protein
MKIKVYGETYLAHGDQNIAEFCEAIQTEYGLAPKPTEIKKGWYRNIPAPPGDDEYTHYLHPAHGPGPGAFFATLWDP